MDKLNTYIIEITETLQKQITVETKSEDNAIQEVHKMYNENKIVLDYDNLVSLSIVSDK